MNADFEAPEMMPEFDMDLPEARASGIYLSIKEMDRFLIRYIYG